MAAVVAAYTIAGVVVGLAAVVFFPVSPALVAPFDWAGTLAPLVAVAFWVAVALVAQNVGSIETSSIAISPETATLVVVAALGGPAAAAVVAALGVTEARELRRVPWYGIAANHGAAVAAWVLAALVMRQTAGPFPAASPLLGLAAFAVGTASAALVEGLLAAALYAARTGQPPTTAYADGVSGDLAVTYAAAGTLGWLTAQAYAAVAWWSPLLLIVGVVAEARSLSRQRDGWLLRHHQLTALPNGLGLRERIADMRGSPVGLAVLYVDLDGFKAVNDDHDHSVGDDVLRIVGGRLRGACRPGDFLAHLHGDEFVVLASGVATEADAAALAGRLVAAVEPVIEHEAGQLRVSATVGHRLVADRAGLEAAIRDADRAMSKAKAAKGKRLGVERRRYLRD